MFTTYHRLLLYEFLHIGLELDLEDIETDTGDKIADKQTDTEDKQMDMEEETIEMARDNQVDMGQEPKHKSFHLVAYICYLSCSSFDFLSTYQDK